MSRNPLLETGTKSEWLNVWVFAYKLNGCGFESSWSHFNYEDTTTTFTKVVLMLLLLTLNIFNKTCTQINQMFPLKTSVVISLVD